MFTPKLNPLIYSRIFAQSHPLFTQILVTFLIISQSLLNFHINFFFLWWTYLFVYISYWKMATRKRICKYWSYTIPGWIEQIYKPSIPIINIHRRGYGRIKYAHIFSLVSNTQKITSWYGGGRKDAWNVTQIYFYIANESTDYEKSNWNYYKWRNPTGSI